MIDPRSTRTYKLEKENRKLKKEIEKLNKEVQFHKKMEIIAIDCLNESTENVEKATEELQKIIDEVNNKKLINVGQFVIKLETIQDELVGGSDK